ncbi:hypothetical protein ACWEFJ_38785 [Actinosynnema sp. NPDC004786]
MRAWLDAAVAGPNYRKHGFDSVHIDELIDDYTESRALALGFDLLDELVRAYEPQAANMMASLAIVLSYEDHMDLSAPEAAHLAGAWDGFTPPDIYVQARAPRLVPYVVEEYKKPYPTGTFTAPYGIYYAYYRCHRQSDSVEYTRAVYVEHYPAA